MPPPAVTVTSTVPVPGGDVVVIDVGLTTVNGVAGLPAPKETAVTAVKFVPVIVTEVPPAPGPVEGLIPVTVGAGM